jgi:hypothetical protein
MGDFYTSTHKYIKALIAENDKLRLLYGDKAKKLEFIKDYMNLEQIDYDAATYIVQKIERCRDTYSPPNRQKS